MKDQNWRKLWQKFDTFHHHWIMPCFALLPPSRNLSISITIFTATSHCHVENVTFVLPNFGKWKIKNYHSSIIFLITSPYNTTFYHLLSPRNSNYQSMTNWTHNLTNLFAINFLPCYIIIFPPNTHHPLTLTFLNTFIPPNFKPNNVLQHFLPQH